jgi:hypothetical protein
MEWSRLDDAGDLIAAIVIGSINGTPSTPIISQYPL